MTPGPRWAAEPQEKNVFLAVNHNIILLGYNDTRLYRHTIFNPFHDVTVEFGLQQLVRCRSWLFWDVRSMDWWLVTDVSGQTIRPIFKGTTGCPKSQATTNLRCVTSQKSEDPIYTAAEA